MKEGAFTLQRDVRTLKYLPPCCDKLRILVCPDFDLANLYKSVFFICVFYDLT